MSKKSSLDTIASVALLLATVLFVAALYLARGVFIPLALALLLAFLLSPVVNRMRRWGIPNIFAVLATAACAFALLAIGLTLVGRELTTFVSDLPTYKEELIAKVKSVSGFRSDVGGSLTQLSKEVSQVMEAIDEESQAIGDGSEAKASQQIARTANEGSVPDRQSSEATPSRFDWFKPLNDSLFAKSEFPKKRVHDGTTRNAPLYMTEVGSGPLPLASWATTIGSVLGPMGTAGLVTVFALFMLVHRDDLRDRMIAVISRGNYVTTNEALDEVAHRITRYLAAQTIVNTIYGIILTIGLLTIGRTLGPDGVFPSVLLWGALAGCLRFVPYVGPIVGAVFPLAVSLAVFPGFGVFLSVLGLIVVMELLSNNVLEPWLYGASTGISAVAVILAAVFWGWLWGPVGLLLSTPLTVCLVVLGRHVPQFKIFSTLLGEEVQVKPSLRLYQRLLAHDERRTLEMLTKHESEHGAAAVCDDVVIPAVKRLRDDCNAGKLTTNEAVELLRTVEQSLDSVQWTRAAGAPSAEEEVDASDSACASRDAMAGMNFGLPSVIGCPAHHASERVVLKVLAEVMQSLCEFELVDVEALPDEIAKRIVRSNPPVVVVSVIPTGGFSQARYLCRAIRRGGYQGAIVVACFGNFKSFDRLFVKLRKSGATYMTTSFLQTQSKIAGILLRTGGQAAREQLESEPELVPAGEQA